MPPKNLTLAVAFARELAELTGETPSRLYQWGKDLGLPVPRARQTFYSHLAGNGWERESETTSTENCRMGSRPMNCELRLRVVSLLTQFSRDKKAARRRQLIVLFGYEVCSHLLHFRVYRGTDYEGEGDLPLCKELPPAIVTEFVEECGQMIGLPLQKVLLTHALIDLTPPVIDTVAFLSLQKKEVIWKKRSATLDDNEVPCSSLGKTGNQAGRYVTIKGAHPFNDWCETTNAAELTSELSDLVKRHNKNTALPRLDGARQAFEALLLKSHEGIKKKFKYSPWPVPDTRFMQRMTRHGYALQELTLHEVRFYKRRYENFILCPGDCSPKAEGNGA
jgi:hypothetical protein